MKEWTTATTIGLGHQDKFGELAKQLQKSYTVYGDLLLLSPKSVASNVLQTLSKGASLQLWKTISKHLKVGHIAVNHAIPTYDEHLRRETNTIRSPSNFHPLYGDFGPSTCSDPPTQQDFDAAFWVSAKQNGIAQIWAPRWTMFSRGNITEKARLLIVPSVVQAVEAGKANGRGCAAVDLYAGIGYFTFSYLKAGVDKVLCWDINDWSVEGLRRGATANKWAAELYDGSQSLAKMAESDAKLLVFNESNELASERIRAMADLSPPIRHVNCGLLPSSRGSWRTALSVLDAKLGGWIHVHENIDQRELDQKVNEIIATFKQLLGNIDNTSAARELGLESVNRVKAYAPNVYHYVLDIYVPPRDAG